MNKQYTVAAIDDEPLATKLIEKLCENDARLQFIAAFENPQKGLEFIHETPVDILILDIEMPELNGLEFARQCPQETKVIFSTAYDQFAVEGFDLAVTDYLLKPYTVERFSTAIEKAIYLFQLEENAKSAEGKNSITVMSNYSRQKIFLDDILYIESFDDYITFHLIPEMSIVVRKPLKRLMEELPSDRFVRIHRSYVVSLDKVTRYTKNKVFLGEKELPLSNTHKDAFLQTQLS